MTNRESQIEKYLVDQVKAIDGLCWKFVSPGVSGVPDRIILIEGHTYFVEVKTEDGRLDKLQHHRCRQIRDRGISVNIVRNKDQVDALIDRILNENKV
jgi:hypothetical protein